MPDQDLSRAITYNIMQDSMDLDRSRTGAARTLSKPLELDERIVTFHKPRSIESEYFRFLKSRIEYFFESHESEDKGKVILVTGANLGAGKTVCAINLAMVFAKAYGPEVLLLDADSRHTACQQYLGMPDKELAGFSDVITLKKRAGSVLVNTGLSDLIYFPSGRFTDDYSDRLKGNELKVLLENLRQRFRYVIVDSPPAFPMPETAVLARHSDGVLLVMKAGRDGAHDLEQAREVLEGANILGVILNGIKQVPGQRYGSYGYYGGSYGSKKGF
jgi:capsular exopolysaccharide synthesis family protein